MSTRTYDNRHRVTRYTDPRGRTVQYAYDLHGNLTRLTYPDGKTVTYTYDLHDRLVTVRDWANRVTRYTWDAAHRLRRLERPNGTSRQLTYDPAGQLLQVDERDAEGVLLAAARLAYDLDGQPRQRLVLPVPPVLAVPPATMTVDADNRVTTVNNAGVTHDADGQLTAGPLPSGAPAGYTFDARHRLQSVGGVSYTYDVEGHRVALTTSTGTLRYTIDPHGGALPRVLVREEVTGSPTLAVYGLGLLYEVEASGAVRYYHYDETGSTIALTEASGLVVTDRMGYGPFGTLVVRKGTTPTPYLYGGLFGVETDPNGLLYMRARYYHPLLRRFLSPDPLGFAGGLNWYVYAGNNPYQFGDPTGLRPQDLAPGASPFTAPPLEPGLEEAFNPLELLVGVGEIKAALGLMAGTTRVVGELSQAAVKAVGGRVVTKGIKAQSAFEQTAQRVFRNKVIQQNEIVRDSTGRVIGEIDFETADAIVEVGQSLGKKSQQLFKLAEIARDRGKRLDILYDPTVTPPHRLETLRNQLGGKFGNRIRFIPFTE